MIDVVKMRESARQTAARSRAKGTRPVALIAPESLIELADRIEALQNLLREAAGALEIVQADVKLTSNAYEAQRQVIAAIREALK